MSDPRETPNAAAPAYNPAPSAIGASELQPGGLPDPNPQAPADTEEVAEQTTRFEELSGLLSRVDSHVSQGYDALVDASDDDTDPPHTSDLGQSKNEIDQAYELEDKAKAILDKEDLTNQDVAQLGDVLDELQSTIEEATPLSFVDTGEDSEP